MNIPFGVTMCLYSGIVNKITSVNKQIDYVKYNKNEKNMKTNIKEQYDYIVEAIDFYEKYCVVSSTHLREQLNELKMKYNRFVEDADN